jgi:hypothetical protein
VVDELKIVSHTHFVYRCLLAGTVFRNTAYAEFRRIEMKIYSRLCVLGAGLILTTAFASADTVQLGSYGSSDPSLGNNNSALAFGKALTFNEGTGGIWTAPGAHSSWVAQKPDDCPGCGHVEPNGIYTFTSTFNLTDPTHDKGEISVMADDTTDVWLNGHLIQAFSTGTNHTCQDLQPNCLTPLGVVLPSSDFAAGVNTLTFDVHQTRLHGEGVDFTGEITSTPPIPEPGTLLLLGTGLIGAAGGIFRRLRR